MAVLSLGDETPLTSATVKTLSSHQNPRACRYLQYSRKPRKMVVRAVRAQTTTLVLGPRSSAGKAPIMARSGGNPASLERSAMASPLCRWNSRRPTDEMSRCASRSAPGWWQCSRLRPGRGNREGVGDTAEGRSPQWQRDIYGRNPFSLCSVLQPIPSPRPVAGTQTHATAGRWAPVANLERKDQATVRTSPHAALGGVFRKGAQGGDPGPTALHTDSVVLASSGPTRP